jgi:hypothetical protein
MTRNLRAIGGALVVMVTIGAAAIALQNSGAGRTDGGAGPSRCRCSSPIRSGRNRQQRFLYGLDGSNKAGRVVSRQPLEQVSSIGGHAGHNAREFFHAHSLAGADTKGSLYIGEVNDGQR